MSTLVIVGAIGSFLMLVTMKPGIAVGIILNAIGIVALLIAGVLTALYLGDNSTSADILGLWIWVFLIGGGFSCKVGNKIATRK
jgi:hypothetical protein